MWSKPLMTRQRWSHNSDLYILQELMKQCEKKWNEHDGSILRRLLRVHYTSGYDTACVSPESRRLEGPQTPCASPVNTTTSVCVYVCMWLPLHVCKSIWKRPRCLSEGDKWGGGGVVSGVMMKWSPTRKGGKEPHAVRLVLFESIKCDASQRPHIIFSSPSSYISPSLSFGVCLPLLPHSHTLSTHH